MKIQQEVYFYGRANEKKKLRPKYIKKTLESINRGLKDMFAIRAALNLVFCCHIMSSLQRPSVGRVVVLLPTDQSFVTKLWSYDDP